MLGRSSKQTAYLKKRLKILMGFNGCFLFEQRESWKEFMD